jgi:hypothetical protein
MAEMAEHAEQTGSFESAVRNYVKRYNAIVEHLEDNDIVPEELFPRLEEETDFGQLGAEATLLAGYLDDLVEETPPPASGKGSKAPDLGMMVALAPFLESRELSKLLQGHFGNIAPAAEENSAPQSMNLKTLVGLAPHVDRATLGQMVRACLASEQIDDPNMLVALAPHVDKAILGEMVRACVAQQKFRDPNILIALAPHMDRHEFGQILRDYAPELFGGQASPHAPEKPAAPDAGPNWLDVHQNQPQAPSAPPEAPPPPPAPHPEER